MRACVWTLVLLESACPTLLCGAAERPAAGDGYHLVRYVADPALHRGWVFMKDSMHPGAPGRIFETEELKDPMQDKAASASALLEESSNWPSAALVRAGDTVVISRQQGSASLRLAGTALTSAGLGECASLRTDVAKGEAYGIVRGPGRVELATKLTCSRRSVR